MEPSIFARVKSTARAVQRGSVPMAARSISTPSWGPASWHLVTSRSCRCRRTLGSSPRAWFIAPQDGAEKQDCERTAAKRWLARHGAAVKHFRPVFLGDDLFACQPIAVAVQQAGGNFIFTCKPASHQTITEYLHGAELEEHRQTIRKRGKHTTIVYRWLTAVPLRATADAIAVNWFSIEIFNDKGKRTYHNSFVTELP